MFSEQSGPEARQWLESNGQAAALASNRFGSTREALEFVNALYIAGAKTVMIPSEAIRDDETELAQGGPYADAIIIELDPAKDSTAVLELYRQETLSEGYDLSAENPVVDDRWLYMWWD
ncbi:MAG TPA: hypothetical protein VFZ59_24080 [Verrucomicrobiae bacterium]|nr:hypothetical protein [Verrucomicrobiae bacterium]